MSMTRRDDANVYLYRHPDGSLTELVEAAAPERLDVQRLGFTDLLDIADALLTHYPPETIVCSHRESGDIGARTVASIADLVASCRARLTDPRP